MTKPKLTVVTVVKNDPEGLRATLASGAESRLIDKWLIIDGSDCPLAVEAVVADFDSLPISLHSEPDHGPYHAMNQALTLSESEEFLWFMNAGDLFASSAAVEKIISFLTDDQVWLFGRTLVRTTSGLEKVIENRKFSPLRYSYGMSSAYHQSMIVKSAAMTAVGGFDTKYRISADYKATILLGRLAQPLVLDDILSIYYGGGISDRNIKLNIAEQSLIRKEILDSKFSGLVVDPLYDGYRRLRLFCRNIISRFK